MTTRIRPYDRLDRDAVRRAAWLTAFQGAPANIFFEDEELFKDYLTLYFTDREPESCFVAESEGRIVGYIIGARDVRRMNRIFMTRVLPGLLRRLLLTSTLRRPRNRSFLGALARSFFKGEFSLPPVPQEYPATLHINLLEDFRGAGLGAALIKTYLAYLQGKAVGGVYLATMSEKAAAFFQTQGFTEFCRGRRTYFKHIGYPKVPAILMGRRL